MKIITKITGLLLAFTLILNTSIPLSYADTEPEKACKAAKQLFEEKVQLKEWETAERKDQNTYEEVFDELRASYHDYIGCMFGYAEGTILLSDGSEQSGTWNANLLNTGGLPVLGYLIDWMTPAEACLSSDELRKIVQNTDPSQMLEPILKAHSAYARSLQELGDNFGIDGVMTDEDGNDLKLLDSLFAKEKQLATITRRIKLEINNSLLAIDMMFTSLRELRQAIVIHVHFQCTLKYLEKYRKELEKLREVIEPLPDQLEDASTH